MTSAPLEVKVIYDSSSGRGKRGTAVTRTGAANSRWLVVGLLNLLLAGAFYYGTWWRVDREVLYPKLLMKSTIPGVDLNQVTQALGPKNAPRRRPAPPSRVPMTIDKETIQLWVVSYSWLTLATIAYGALALSAGSLLGRWRGGSIRRIGVILTVAAASGLGLAAYIVLSKHGMSYPTGALRWAMGGLGALLLLLGLAIASRVRGLAKLASIALLLSAVGSAVGLILFGNIDAVPKEQTTVTFVGMVFVIHAFWAFILWPISSRLPR